MLWRHCPWNHQALNTEVFWKSLVTVVGMRSSFCAVVAPRPSRGAAWSFWTCSGVLLPALAAAAVAAAPPFDKMLDWWHFRSDTPTSCISNTGETRVSVIEGKKNVGTIETVPVLLQTERLTDWLAPCALPPVHGRGVCDVTAWLRLHWRLVCLWRVAEEDLTAWWWVTSRQWCSLRLLGYVGYKNLNFQFLYNQSVDCFIYIFLHTLIIW